MIRRFSLFLTFIFSISVFVDLKGMSLEETALIILRKSPEYKSETYSFESLKQVLRTDGNLPDPQINGEYLAAPSKEGDRWASELSWGLEWPGVYTARNKEADKKLEVAKKRLYANRLDKLSEIKILLLNYILCQQKLVLLEDLTSNTDSIYRLSIRAVKDGEITTLDLNKIRLEYANIRASKASLLYETATIEGELSKIMGENCKGVLSEMSLKFPEIILPTKEEMERLSLFASEVEIANADIEATKQAKKVATMEALPSISVGYKHAYEEGMHFNGALLGISIPIFSSRNKQKVAKAAILESEYNAEAAGKLAETTSLQSLNKLTLLKSQLDEIEPILENSDHNTILLKAYKGGVITLIDYLSERNYFTIASNELISLRHSAAVAQIELNKYLKKIDL